jgi:hypothetical protein
MVFEEQATEELDLNVGRRGLCSQGARQVQRKTWGQLSRRPPKRVRLRLTETVACLDREAELCLRRVHQPTVEMVAPPSLFVDYEVTDKLERPPTVWRLGWRVVGPPTWSAIVWGVVGAVLGVLLGLMGCLSAL